MENVVVMCSASGKLTTSLFLFLNKTECLHMLWRLILFLFNKEYLRWIIDHRILLIYSETIDRTTLQICLLNSYIIVSFSSLQNKIKSFRLTVKYLIKQTLRFSIQFTKTSNQLIISFFNSDKEKKT